MRSSIQKHPFQFISSSVSSNILIYGLLTSALLAAYFLCISLLAPEYFVELRYGNLFILGAGIFLALRDYFSRNAAHHTNYLDGWIIGLVISMVSGLALGLFMLFFLSELRPDIGMIVHEQISFGKLPLSVLPVTTFIEAVFSGIMVSFLGMQYFKNFSNVGHKF